jgi:hypothetical protein
VVEAAEEGQQGVLGVASAAQRQEGVGGTEGVAGDEAGVPLFCVITSNNVL